MMIYFFPFEDMVLSAGKKHVLTSSEAEYMCMMGTIEWDDARQGYVLAPGKVWSDYVSDMNIFDPPDDDYSDLHYDEEGPAEDRDEFDYELP